ncbi:MAG: secondary thiamine-phosphate synthase enzyme YjbQ [Candidatus Izimaplasma sp.]|nr:secondary thiamine-phosphate synthase enzyme YjbQ [Candidatus Izimaplasma bacterium]
MNSITKTLQIKTNHPEEMLNITSIVEKELNKSSIKTGTITLFVPHTTAAVTINENADPDVKKDILFGLEKSFPKHQEYKHFEGNSFAHIKSSVIGVSQTLLVDHGKILLGKWQGIYYCEFDGPRTRELILRITS